MGEFIQVITVTDSQDEAASIAKHLVEQQLAACVQIWDPVTSTFWWKGEVQQEKEYACVVKTRGSLYEKVEQAIRKVHSYEVPEVLAVPVENGAQDFLDWIRNETTG